MNAAIDMLEINSKTEKKGLWMQDIVNSTHTNTNVVFIFVHAETNRVLRDKNKSIGYSWKLVTAVAAERVAPADHVGFARHTLANAFRSLHSSSWRVWLCQHM